jgi:putative FmdB family regulatory protein
MPIYDYKCAECGSIYDVFHKVREVAEDVVCPSCGSQKHTKMMSAPNLSISSGSPSNCCAEGTSCGMESGGCAGGMCGLN